VERQLEARSYRFLFLLAGFFEGFHDNGCRQGLGSRLFFAFRFMYIKIHGNGLSKDCLGNQSYNEKLINFNLVVLFVDC
jgi:hypothetical protein